MGIFADLTDKFDVSNYYEGPVNSCTLDGKLYGVPFGSNDLVLFYNEDMLKEAGCEVPATWDELLEAAKKTTTDSVSGFAHCVLQNEERKDSLREMMSIRSSLMRCSMHMQEDPFLNGRASRTRSLSRSTR